MFYELCDEVNDHDWAAVLQQLIELLEAILKHTNKKYKRQSKVNFNIGLPVYPILSGFICLFLRCES